MPKLGSKAAADAKKAAAGSSFEPLDPGTYRARLTSVTPKQASTGNPMWVWEFEVVEDPYEGRRLWTNTVLTDAAMWKVGQVFAAFGADTETDTDELIGEHCRLEVVQRTIGAGARAGQTGNDVRNVLPDEGAKVGAPAGQAQAPKGDDDPGW